MSKFSFMLMMMLCVFVSLFTFEAVAANTNNVPGMVALDLNDNLSDNEIKAIAVEYNVTLEETSYLSEDTKIHKVNVGVGNVKDFIKKLQKDDRVQHVEPVIMYHANFSNWTPNDPLLTSQWHMKAVGAERAWMYATGRGVKVAVVDTGVTCEDKDGFKRVSDLANTKCITGYNFVNDTEFAMDNNGHGTHVTGTIAQSTNNNLGGVGLAFHATIIPVKVLDGSGSGTHLQVADGIRFAADAGANVINMSLGGGNSEIIHDAVKYARSKGVVVVCAAGNNGSYVEYPGAHPESFTVSATDEKNKIAGFSSRGPEVDIAAPGVNILQQIIRDDGRNGCKEYKKLNGTSMATPHVAGAAALLISAGVTNPRMVEELLMSNTSTPTSRITRIISGNQDELYGAGVLNVGKALTYLTLKQVSIRLGLVLLIGFVLNRFVKKEDRIKKNVGYMIGAGLFGVGFLSLVPFISSSVSLPMFLLAHPIPDWDLAFSANLHSYLPLATFLIPLGLSACFYNVEKVRPFILGTSVGVAAYMLSVMFLQLVASTTVFGLSTLFIWGVVNVSLCLWIAWMNLKK